MMISLLKRDLSISDINFLFDGQITLWFNMLEIEYWYDIGPHEII